MIGNSLLREFKSIVANIGIKNTQLPKRLNKPNEFNRHLLNVINKDFKPSCQLKHKYLSVTEPIEFVFVSEEGVTRRRINSISSNATSYNNISICMVKSGYNSAYSSHH